MSTILQMAEGATVPERNDAISILTYIRSGYPGGVVPGTDYPALLAVLHRHLSVDEVVGVATELIIRGISPLTGTDLRSAITRLSSYVVEDDVERVTRRLQTGGWSLGAVS